jgi:hypothetical protein
MQNKKPKKGASGRDWLQLRISRDEKPGAELIAKIEKVAQSSGLSMNDVANMAVAAGLQMVETKLREIQNPAPAPELPKAA